jgi:acyl-CoA synthetase (AMP-forming)/AMP-acid ligase II
MQLFHEVIASNAHRYPTKPAIVLDGQSTSYQELQKRVDDIASVLPTLGILPGDRVGLYAPISIDLIASYLGLLRVGATTAATHHTLSRTRLIHQLKHAGARVLITDCTDDLPGLIDEAGLELVLLTIPVQIAIPRVIQLTEVLMGRGGETNAVVSTLTDDPERPTSIFYTSGSTFSPKRCARQSPHYVGSL